jgi:uncharacterized membrane protein YhiD involved in acid resistance
MRRPGGFGSGLYWTAIGTTVLTLFVLEVLPHLENRPGRRFGLTSENGRDEQKTRLNGH